MKNAVRISGVILVILSILLFHSCIKEKATPPVISTIVVTAISYTTATSGGNVTNEGGAPVTARGVCWNTSLDPTVANNKTTDGTGTGSYISLLTGLTAGTIYYVRAYATNTAGTGYGNQVTFTTIQVEAPVLTTTAITSITSSTAISGGNITTDNGSSVTARGVCWSTITNPTTANNKTSDGTGTGSFVSNLISLQPGAIYYVRSYATNSAGTSYGNEINFTTLQPPTATTAAATFLTSTTATLNGTVNANNQSTTVTFEYGTTTSYGQTIIAIPNTVSGSTNTGVSANLSGLTANTTYHFRVKAVSSVGTTYGSDVTFTTLGSIIFNPDLTYGSVSDNDGNTYKTILIGTQTWMAENLKTTKYNDGTTIPLVTVNSAWAALITPGYCWYDNDAATYKATYGALYNWYTVNTGKLCPTGWHVPTDAEWTTLTTSLGGESVASGKLKETGITHWLSPNTGATNESGFTALPGGDRSYSGTFSHIGIYGSWWSSTEYGTYYAWFRYVYYDDGGVHRYYGYKQDGFSVRCLKDGNQGTAVLPVLTTTTVTAIASTTATSGGNITSDGGASVTARGVCWSTSLNPTTALITKTTNGTGTGSFTSSLTGLTANTTYYVRAYATNSVGTAYGTQVSFTTQQVSGSTVTDIDGNVYNTVTIGTQVWMKENLKTIKYNDGTAIPLVTGTAAWAALSTPGYCWYNNDAATYKATYGALYNWYTVNTGKLCPTGWHVHTDAEWTLTTYLGGESVAGGKLKETGTTHWLSPNTGATNESGFTALPGGYRDYNGTFEYIGYGGYWWSSTESSTSSACARAMFNDVQYCLQKFIYKQVGFSVRCLKN
jgi:uncharacterized protein (TIGR02145 family)